MKVSFSRIGLKQPNLTSKINFAVAIIALLLSITFYTAHQIQVKHAAESVTFIEKTIDFFNPDRSSYEKPRFFEVQKVVLRIVGFTILFFSWWNYMVREEYKYKYSGTTLVFSILILFVQFNFFGHWLVNLSMIAFVLFFLFLELLIGGLIEFLIFKPIEFIYDTIKPKKKPK